MTDSKATSTAPEKVDPDSVELRVKPRPVTRINRRVVIGGVALGVTAIAGLVILALRPIVWTAQGPRELLNTETKPYAEGLEGLPRRYDAVRPPERVVEIAPAAGDREQASPDAAAKSPLLDQGPWPWVGRSPEERENSKISFASRVRRARRRSFSRSRARPQWEETARHQLRRPIRRAMH